MGKVVTPAWSEIKDSTGCVICHETFLGGEHTDVPMKIHNCGHVVGSYCLAKWLSPQSPGGKDTCSMCRAPILDLPNVRRTVGTAGDLWLLEIDRIKTHLDATRSRSPSSGKFRPVGLALMIEGQSLSADEMLEKVFRHLSNLRLEALLELDRSRVDALARQFITNPMKRTPLGWEDGVLNRYSRSQGALFLEALIRHIDRPPGQDLTTRDTASRQSIQPRAQEPSLESRPSSPLFGTLFGN